MENWGGGQLRGLIAPKSVKTWVNKVGTMAFGQDGKSKLKDNIVGRVIILKFALLSHLIFSLWYMAWTPVRDRSADGAIRDRWPYSPRCTIESCKSGGGLGLVGFCVDRPWILKCWVKHLRVSTRSDHPCRAAAVS